MNNPDICTKHKDAKALGQAFRMPGDARVEHLRLVIRQIVPGVGRRSLSGLQSRL